MGRSDLSRAVAGMERACARAETPDDLFELVGTELRRSVPFDGSMWFGLDPTTLLPTAPSRFEHMDGGYCDCFWHHEFHEQDVALFADLARAPVPATALRLATGNRPVRSPRYREFVEPQGFDDELRVIFRAGSSAWGSACLYREKGGPAFTAEEVELLGAISLTIAVAVRARAALATEWQSVTDAPGLLCFNPENMLVSANAEATCFLREAFGPGPSEDWIEVLRGEPATDLRIPMPIIPLLRHARAVATGVEPGPARLRLRGRNGRWLVLHASCLLRSDGSPGDVAVVVGPAKSAEIAPIIIEAYGLTARERDVLRGLARGLTTPEVASELHLSTHTVRDYIKTVFDKTGTNSRGELVAKLFAEHYTDALHDAAVHID